MSQNKVVVGISGCLLGQQVRFDGGHKRDRFLLEQLGAFFEWRSVCPEVEVGMPVPRPPLRLTSREQGIRLIQPKTGADWTDRMRSYSRDRVVALEQLDLSGFVLKKDSPSCGAFSVKVYPGTGGCPARTGQGLFAAELMARFPDLPIEEEGRLRDIRLRENWVERVCVYHKLKRLERNFSPGALIAFHTAHKLTLLSRGQGEYRALGRIVARAGNDQPAELMAAYRRRLMRALSRVATRGNHTNVLQHMLGYFRRKLDSGSRRRVREQILAYRRGLVPLMVPVSLLAHHVELLRVDYLAGQAYLDPHPAELALRYNL